MSTPDSQGRDQTPTPPRSDLPPETAAPEATPAQGSGPLPPQAPVGPQAAQPIVPPGTQSPQIPQQQVLPPHLAATAQPAQPATYQSPTPPTAPSTPPAASTLPVPPTVPTVPSAIATPSAQSPAQTSQSPAQVVPPHLQSQPATASQPVAPTSTPPQPPDSTQPPSAPAAPTAPQQPTVPTQPAARTKRVPQDQQTTPTQRPTKRQARPQQVATDATSSAVGKSQPIATPQLGVQPTPEDELEANSPQQFLNLILRFTVPNAPPWLVSMLVHLVVIVILALIAIPEIVESQFIVEVSYAEQLGEQLLDDTQFLDSIEPLEADAALAIDARNVENPLASSAMPQIKLDALDAPPDLQTPTIGLALSGRQKGAKKALLAAYGGTATTESAVDLALAWLKRNQRSDGTWSLSGPYKDGLSRIENKVAATAMAMLAFQGAGNTHLVGEYQANVEKGMKALLKMQDRDGSFFANQSLVNSHQLYSQAQATIVICELYGMTQDETLSEPAQRALDYAASIQADDGRGGGGWRYQPGDQADLSVTGWFVIALKSGEMGRLSVPSPIRDKVRRFLDNVEAVPKPEDNFIKGSRYLYKVGERDHRPSMTAEGLLCRQYLGWYEDDPRLLDGVTYMNAHPINWDEPDIYYWYYATQVMHHMGGDSWHQWNEVMRQAIPEAQTKTGRERGSWSPANDNYGYRGGRLFMTCLCTYMLEVYYRHMPIYQH